MKNLTLLILIIVCVLAASGQSKRQKKNDTPVKEVVSVTDRASSGNTKNAAFTTAARTRAAAVDAIPPGPFMAIDAAAWRTLSGRSVIVTPADGGVELGCAAAMYGARSVVLESAHFRAYDAIYSGAERPPWLGPPVARDTIKIFPVVGDLECSFRR